MSPNPARRVTITTNTVSSAIGLVFVPPNAEAVFRGEERIRVSNAIASLTTLGIAAAEIRFADDADRHNSGPTDVSELFALCGSSLGWKTMLVVTRGILSWSTIGSALGPSAQLEIDRVLRQPHDRGTFEVVALRRSSPNEAFWVADLAPAEVRSQEFQSILAAIRPLLNVRQRRYDHHQEQSSCKPVSTVA